MTTAPTLKLAARLHCAAEWFTALLDAVGSQPIGKSPRQCPGHRDEHPSLTVDAGDDGRALIHCHVGCDYRKILKALHCPAGVLYTPPPVSPVEYSTRFCQDLVFPKVELRSGSLRDRGYRLDRVHDYGGWRLERWRNGAGGKELVWFTRDTHGAMIPGLLGTPLSALPLYREPDIAIAEAAGEIVLIVESESSVDALVGWYATTWAGGANAVQIEVLTRVLGGYRNIVVIPDNDDAGRQCLRRLDGADLAPHVLMPPAGEDARDLYQRLGPDEFERAIAKKVEL